MEQTEQLEHRGLSVLQEQTDWAAGTSMQTQYVMRQQKISTVIWCVMRLIAKERKEHRVHKDCRAILVRPEQQDHKGHRAQPERMEQLEHRARKEYREHKVILE